MVHALTKKIRAKGGFTLMEMLIVVGVIAIIGSISITGILTIRKNLAFRQRNDCAKSIFMAAQTRLTELRASDGLGALEAASNCLGVNHRAQLEDDPDTPEVEYGDYVFTASGNSEYSAAYSTVLPVGSVDSAIREQNVIIEYNPRTGNVYSVYYSEDDSALITHYLAGTLPRNGEGDAQLRRDRMLGYYSGSDLPAAEVDLMEMEARIVFDNGEEGVVTVIIPTQDKHDPSFTIAGDGNYNRYMTGLSVKLTMVGEMGGVIETQIKSAGSLEIGSCYVSIDPETGANVIHVTYPIDSLRDGCSFADLASVTENGSTAFLIHPGDNVSITAEVTYTASANDPVVKIENAMVACVNPMFHALTPGSDGTFILTISNDRNLQNLDALSPAIAQRVSSVLFVQDGNETGYPAV